MAQNFDTGIEEYPEWESRPMQLADFQKAQDLGRGQFGRVFAATHM